MQNQNQPTNPSEYSDSKNKPLKQLPERINKTVMCNLLGNQFSDSKILSSIRLIQIDLNISIHSGLLSDKIIQLLFEDLGYPRGYYIPEIYKNKSF